MDPDTTLADLWTTLGALGKHPDDEELRDQAIALLETLAAWLKKGGFPPTTALD